ncbi:MAG: hypothetical protein DRJ42_26045 [Deltaproteobacteria bacterium]|nr:MAG: hypothetical protein DRJ42_26045 [Deltaproteobacteria bacterium]
MCVDLPPADRVTPIACSSCRPTWADPGGSGDCSAHSDCTAGDNGRCVFGMIGAFCSYDECFEDGDCDSNEVCSCDGAVIGGGNRCVSSNCKVGADCSSGRCSPTYGCLAGGPPQGWYCRTAGDTCTADSECTMDGGLGGGRCAYDASAGHWACAYGICVF